MKRGKIKILSDGTHLWYCPACHSYHGGLVNTSERPNWDFNGNYDRPTFSPSFLIRSGHYVPGFKSDENGGTCWCKYNEAHPDEPSPFTCSVCHTFVRDGKIEYLSDCTHEFAGQTIEMIDDTEGGSDT